MKQHLQGATILIVEDEGIIGFQIQQTLKRAGYNVPAVAASAEEALTAIESYSPDLVLMDIHIEGRRDGVDTAREIRHRFHLPVIFVTSHSDEATIDRARSVGPFGYLVKPICTASLTSSIEMALQENKADLVRNGQNPEVEPDIEFAMKHPDFLSGCVLSRSLNMLLPSHLRARLGI